MIREYERRNTKRKRLSIPVSNKNQAREKQPGASWPFWPLWVLE
jgi:hypothetical protein